MGFLRGANIGFGDDFEQGHARTVEVDEGCTVHVGEFAGILFEVHAPHPDGARPLRGPKRERPVAGQGFLVL